MNARAWVLIGFFAALGGIYVFFFTEWLRPAPIEIAYQVRFSAQPPRFGRPPRKTNVLGPAVIVQNQTNKIEKPLLLDRIGWSDQKLSPGAGGVARVTFGLDDAYQLTSITVRDLPADGSPPQIVWEVRGKSRPVRSILYGIAPEGMKPAGASTNVAPLIPGVPYRLTIQAGRRRGTNDFTTAEAAQTG